MKKIIYALLISSIVLSAQGIRPVKDDIGFCWNPAQMQRLIGYLDQQQITPANAVNLVAGISPHDDYLYAAAVYYPLFKAIKCKEVIIFGVTHGAVRKQIGDPQNIVILDQYDQWQCTSGPLAISPLRETIKSKLAQSDMLVSNDAHRLEHSIEALLPFLQYYNPGVRITPIMVTAMPFSRMDALSDTLADIVAAYMAENKLILGRDLFVLISSDGNHYGPDFNNLSFGEGESAHQKATAYDHELCQLLTGELTLGKTASFLQRAAFPGEQYKKIYWCGQYSIPFGLTMAQKLAQRTSSAKLTGKALAYSDSYSGGLLPLTKTGMGITAVFSLQHWVSYFAAGYYLN